MYLYAVQIDIFFNLLRGLTRSRTPVLSQYLLHGQVLESVAGSKYLGVEISNNLSFNSHIQNATTSARRSHGILKRNIRSKNPALKTYAAISNAHLSRVCKRGKLSGSCLSTLNGFGSTQLPIFLCHIGVQRFLHKITN